MKSIKEKAGEYGLLNPDIHYDADGNTYDDIDKPSMDFEAGANFVLDIIEECLEEPSMIQGYSDIMAVVQELKGE